MNETLKALYDVFICGYRLTWQPVNELTNYKDERSAPGNAARSKRSP